MLDQYHYTSGVPIKVTQHHSIQLYPVGPKSLELAYESPHSADILFYKVTLQFANKQPDRILQALVIGRLMYGGKPTKYVVFLDSYGRLYACLSSGIDPCEVGPYRSSDDEDDDGDYEEVDEAQKDEYSGWQECWKVFGDVAVKVVDLGALEDVIEDEGKGHYDILDNVVGWKCFGYAEGKEDPSFENGFCPG